MAGRRGPVGAFHIPRTALYRPSCTQAPPVSGLCRSESQAARIARAGLMKNPQLNPANRPREQPRRQPSAPVALSGRQMRTAAAMRTVAAVDARASSAPTATVTGVICKLPRRRCRPLQRGEEHSRFGEMPSLPPGLSLVPLSLSRVSPPLSWSLSLSRGLSPSRSPSPSPPLSRPRPFLARGAHMPWPRNTTSRTTPRPPLLNHARRPTKSLAAFKRGGARPQA